VVNRIKLIVEA